MGERERLKGVLSLSRECVCRVRVSKRLAWSKPSVLYQAVFLEKQEENRIPAESIVKKKKEKFVNVHLPVDNITWRL